jgi:hypothetical protein
MKNYKAMLITAASVSLILGFGFTLKRFESKPVLKEMATPEKGCVFRTVMGEESAVQYARFKTPEKVTESLNRGLDWMMKAQHANGGWGAGSHSRQDVIDPHAVTPDPATTAMVSMALLRTGNTLREGEQHQALQKALQYLLTSVEATPRNNPNITEERGTQIQSKLGENIDVILTAQFLSNVLDYTTHDAALNSRVKEALKICTDKIQKNQQQDGSIAGAGWAGVLQSSLATTALESAQQRGIEVDDGALNKARDYQKGNYNPASGEARTDMGAGVVLYSVTGSVRASAKEARKVREDVEQGKRDGTIPSQAPVDFSTLHDLGYSPEEARRAVTAYEVYESAKVKAQDQQVMDGFGSNGGEEFLSYLQTGESMIVGKDMAWHKWFDDISGRLLRIQNQNGSWNGHHCITSPVFCTATCLLVLSINNDIDKLTDLGKDRQ